MGGHAGARPRLRLARIDARPDRLWAISVHWAERHCAPPRRPRSSLIAEHVPPSDYVALGGDFNTRGRGETCLVNLAPMFDTGAPHPDDGDANGNTNMTRRLPYDWVLRNASLAAREGPVLLGAAEFPHGLVLTPRLPPLDVPRARGGQRRPCQQHAIVVRDFALE